jgi:hypothetical protein
MGAVAAGDELLGVRYVLGLDIGDGESALAWAAPGNWRDAGVYQRRRTGEESILTALSYVRPPNGDHHEAGGPPRTIFGEEAVLSDRAFHFMVNFKQRPMFGKILEFAKALLDEFFAENPHVAEECLIFIGHPVGWDPNIVEDYRRHMELLGQKVYLLPESQSALVHVRELNRGRPASLDRVLVIDIGSSTVDVTVVEGMRPRNIGVGAGIGCSQIDRDLASMVKATFDGDAEFTAALQRTGGEDMLLLACRRAKEAQFSGRTQSVLDVRAAHNSGYELITERGFGKLKATEIPHEVERGRWASEFEQLLAAVRAELTRPPEVVVLTGGGSRMPFVRRLCHEVFPDADVIPEPGQRPDTDPSLAVAVGLASAGCQRVRAVHFRHAMHAMVTSAETGDYIRGEVGRVFEAVKKSILTAMDSTPKTAWPQLMENPPSKEQIASTLQDAIGAYLEPRAQEICIRYGIDRRRFGIRAELPPFFAGQIVQDIVKAAEPKWTQETVIAGLVSMWSLIKEVRDSRKVMPSALTAAALVLYSRGATAYQEWRIKRKVTSVELSSEVINKLSEDVQSEVHRIVEERASAVEQFVM